MSQEQDPVVLDVPVHIAYVGLDPANVDEDQLLDALPKERTPIVEAVTGTTGMPTHQPVTYRFSYTFHEASDAFTEGFFEAALDASEKGRPNEWLVAYDRDGPQRLCDACLGVPGLEEADDMLYLDARATEAWAMDNRADHGLAFEPEAVTILLLDGEGSGHLPTDTYHSWRFDDGFDHSKVPKEGMAPSVPAPIEAFEEGHVAPFHTPKDTLTMRAWGGASDLLWLDLTAAPTMYDHQPRAPVEDWTDDPLWELEGDAEAITENLGRNLGDFLQLRVARDPIYPVDAFERFHTPIMVFVEEGAMENPQTGLGVDLEAWVPQEDIERSLGSLMPWVDIEAPVTFHTLPEDDPEMSQAIKEAKAYGNPSQVSAGYIKSYVRDNWEDYVPEPEEGTFVMPQFYYFFNGPYTFWGVSSAGGWADGDAQGHPWAIFNHFFDLCVREDIVPCSKATIGFRNLTILPLHEAGHELGLTHTKDTVDLDDDGWNQWRVNWLWDSMFSQMSYRHTYMQFDHWDERFMAISHATDLIHRAEASGDAEAKDAAAEAREHLSNGAWLEAVEAAQAAAQAAGEGLEPASSPVEELLVDTQVEVPASQTLIGSQNLGILGLPAPMLMDEEGVTSASVPFHVPEDAEHVRIHYEDAVPEDAGTFKSSWAVVVGPDGTQRGFLSEDYEDEVVLKSHWRGAGDHELRVHQYSGTPGLYDVSIAVAR